MDMATLSGGRDASRGPSFCPLGHPSVPMVSVVRLHSKGYISITVLLVQVVWCKALLYIAGFLIIRVMRLVYVRPVLSQSL